LSLLEVQNLTRTFGGVRAVDELSFSVDSGAIHSVIGPNGAGKTTLFNLITGVYKPTAGRIMFEGTDVTGMAPSVLAGRGISRTFQNLQIFFNMTARENVMVGRHRHLNSRVVPALFRLPSIVRADDKAWRMAGEILEYMELGKYADLESDQLPYSALKRLEIARAFATEPKMMLLDEPAAGLDRNEIREIDALIQRIAASGVTVLLVEHDMKLVMAVSDHILVLESGRKLAEGTAEEIRGNADVVTAYLGRATPSEAL